MMNEGGWCTGVGESANLDVASAAVVERAVQRESDSRDVCGADTEGQSRKTDLGDEVKVLRVVQDHEPEFKRSGGE